MSDRSFKQRKYYWKKKGYSEEESIKLAKNLKSESGRVVNIDFPVPKEHNAKKVMETKKNKEKNSMNKKSSSKKRFFGIENLLLFCLSVILTTILVISSVQYFGLNFIGWGKAIALECSILGLVIYRPTSILEKLAKSFCMICAVSLSIFVLHTGSQINSYERNESVADINSSISSLEKIVSKQEENLNNIPENYRTEKNNVLKEISNNTAQLILLREKKENLIMTSVVSVPSLSEITDSLVRIVFLFINMFFTHALAKKLRRSDEKASIEKRVVEKGKSKIVIEIKNTATKMLSKAFEIVDRNRYSGRNEPLKT